MEIPKQSKTFCVIPDCGFYKIDIPSNLNWKDVKEILKSKLDESKHYTFRQKQLNDTEIKNDDEWREFFSNAHYHENIFAIENTDFFIKSELVKMSEQIGSGPYGIVYKATLNSKDVAYKNILSFRLDKLDELHQICRVSSHKNLVKYFGHMGSTFLCDIGIVSELMSRDLNLLHLIQTKTFNLDQKIECCRQIANGLTFLHQNGKITALEKL